MKPASTLALTLVLFLTFVWAAPPRAAADSPTPASERYWPRWRGPLATGEAPHADPPRTWSESENVRWKVEIPGRGHASPVVWGDKIFLLTASDTGKPAPAAGPAAEPEAAAPLSGRRRSSRGVTPDRLLRFEVLALSRVDGRVLWRRTAREELPHESTHTDGTWASASAVTDGELLFAHFGSRGLYAYDLEGNPRWEKDLGDMQTRLGFGEGSSPALHGETLVVNWDHEGDSFVVALDRRTGRELWRREREEVTSWSTPLVVEQDGKAQVVISATHRVRGYDLASGEPLWETGGMTLNTIPTPVAGGGLVYATSGFRGTALRAIRLAGAKGDLTGTDAVAWAHDRDTPYVPSPLLYRGALYFLKSNQGILTSLDAATGEVRYGPVRLPGVSGVYASPVAAAGRIYIAGRDGTTLVLADGPDLEVLAENTLDEGFDASPAIVGNELYLRGRRHLYCLVEEVHSPAW